MELPDCANITAFTADFIPIFCLALVSPKLDNFFRGLILLVWLVVVNELENVRRLALALEPANDLVSIAADSSANGSSFGPAGLRCTPILLF